MVKPSASAVLARRVVPAVLAAIIAVGASLWLALPAQAAETLIVRGDRDAQAWFWSSNRDVRQCTPFLPDPLPPDSYCHTTDLSAGSPISPGHLGVALRSGDNDMRTYLLFDLIEIPEGSTVSSATLELSVSLAQADSDHAAEHGQPGAKAPATANESIAGIKAHLVTIPWAAAEGAPSSNMNPRNPDPDENIKVEPTLLNGVDYSVSSIGLRSAAGDKWKFDMKPFVTKWLSGEFNNGIILVPQLTGPLDTWTVEFHGGEYIRRINDPSGSGATQEVKYVSAAAAPKLTVTYIAPPEEPEPTLEPTLAPVPTGGEVVSQPPPVDTPAPAPEPSTVTEPQLPLAASQPRTPWYLWLVLPAGLLGITALSRSMGRELGVAGGNRVALMLRRRRDDRG